MMNIFANFVIWCRQIYCEHQFEYEEVLVETINVFDNTEQSENYRIVRTCKLCGHHTSYDKV